MLNFDGKDWILKIPCQIACSIRKLLPKKVLLYRSIKGSYSAGRGELFVCTKEDMESTYIILCYYSHNNCNKCDIKMAVVISGQEAYYSEPS